ncbi:MAG: hypothetical protein EA415_10585, partial [Sphaerobacteraceae bacterium]
MGIRLAQQRRGLLGTGLLLAAIAGLLFWGSLYSAGQAQTSVPASNSAELIAALENMDAGDSITITLTAHEYFLDAIDNTTPSGNNGLPVINGNVTIEGNGAVIRRSADSTFRIFEVDSNRTLNLHEITIRGGGGVNVGGGIYVNNAGTLTLSSSTVRDNGAIESGGGIFNAGGTLTLINSTVSGNQANLIAGGGIVNSGGTLTLTSSTISDNWAYTGGGIHNDGIATLTGTVVAGNQSIGDPDIAGDGSLSAASAYNFIGEDPQLGTLQHNGGPTETMMPQSASPLIDAIPLDSGNCATGELEDQRGVSRPQGGGCDIGALEVAPGLLYVDQSATDGVNNGTSWDNAFTDLQQALAEVSKRTVPIDIFVAGGTYYPTPENAPDRDASFVIPDGV